ncbi:MAG: 4-(cytidine 5'-diphospho)-2-C-methyl-D-erythritol kinase [Rhizobium sp.]
MVAPEGGASAAIIESAPAKINLALHVTGQRADGYHLLDSIVTFAGDGDRLFFEPATEDRFSVSGRFGQKLCTDPNGVSGNLVLRARDTLRQALRDMGQRAPAVGIDLEKNLPIASGIGGGSADAAATLRGLMRLWGCQLGEPDISRIALALGADVPMCLRSKPLRAGGIGENIALLPEMPSFALVLANPLEGVSTPEIFRRLAQKDNPPISGSAASPEASAWIAYLSRLRNDLEGPARDLLPEIGEISAMLARKGAKLVRMSGSGATCFGIFADYAAASAAARALSQERPDWYFLATETAAGDAP